MTAMLSTPTPVVTEDQIERTLKLLRMPVIERASSAPSQCPFTEDIGTVMSNFDHEVDEGAEERLDSETFGQHAAVEFNGRVWREAAGYVCEVWRFREPQPDLIRAPTLAALMKATNDVWGWE